MTCCLSNPSNQMRFSATPKMVRRECAPTFQAAMSHILGKVRDIGDEHADSSSEKEKRCHPAVNTPYMSAVDWQGSR